MSRFLVLVAAAALAAAIPMHLRNERHDNPGAPTSPPDDTGDFINVPAPTGAAAGPDFCTTAKDKFLANCKTVIAAKSKAVDSDCGRLWDLMAKCLDGGRLDNAKCDTFVTEAIKIDDVFVPKAPKAVVFWSGAAAAAAKFAHAPGGRKGFVLDDTTYGRLLAGWDMAKRDPKAPVAPPSCNKDFGWPAAATIVPWERASLHLAESVNPEDEVYVLLKRFRALAVFGAAELPTIVGRGLAAPVRVRMHKDTVFNENGLKYTRACERVKADVEKFASAYVPKGKTVRFECIDGLGDDYATGGGPVLPFTLTGAK